DTVIRRIPESPRLAVMRLSPDGKAIALGDSDSVIRLYAVDKDAEPIVLKGHVYAIDNLAFSPDSRLLASSDSASNSTLSGDVGKVDHVVRVWDVRTGKQVREFPGHLGGIGQLLWTPDSKQLIVRQRRAII